MLRASTLELPRRLVGCPKMGSKVSHSWPLITALGKPILDRFQPNKGILRALACFNASQSPIRLLYRPYLRPMHDRNEALEGRSPYRLIYGTKHSFFVRPVPSMSLFKGLVSTPPWRQHCPSPSCLTTRSQSSLASAFSSASPYSISTGKFLVVHGQLSSSSVGCFFSIYSRLWIQLYGLLMIRLHGGTAKSTATSIHISSPLSQSVCPAQQSVSVGFWLLLPTLIPLNEISNILKLDET